MIVRIQLGPGRRVQRTGGKNRNLALACAALLIPIALMAYVVGFWRLGSDMGIVAPSGITGPFSHWQVAIGAAVFLHACSRALNRYGHRGEFHLPDALPEALKVRLLPLRSESRRQAKSG